MTTQSTFKSTLIKSLLATSLLLPLFPFASPAAATQGVSVWLDGKALTYQTPITVINNTTYVPLRETLEALGAKVEWNAVNGAIKITKGSLSFNYDPKADQFDGVQAPITKNGRLLVHIRALSYLLGTEVQWNAAKNAVELETEQTALIEAIHSQNVQAVKTALQQDVNLNVDVYDMEYKWKLPLLLYAANDLSVLKTLLDAGADPNVEDSALMSLAMLIGNDVIKMALDYGANPDRDFYRLNTEMIRYVLSSPYKEKVSTPSLQQALKVAIENQNLEAVQLLLDAGTQPNLDPEAAEQEEEPINMLLFKAIQLNNREIVESLIKHGIDLNAQTEEGWTPLMKAAALGNASIVKSLLAAHADPDLTNSKGATAWMIAQGLGNSETVEALIAGGVKTDATVPTDLSALSPTYEFYDHNKKELDQLSPLFKAVLLGQTGEVKRLLQENKTKAQDATTDRYVITQPLMVGYTEMFKALFSDKTLFDQQTWDELLLSAISQGNQEVISTLLENGTTSPSNDQQDQLGYRLEDAAAMNNVALVELLLKHGVKQVPSNNGEIYTPPLARAAEKGNTDTLRFLLTKIDTLSESERDKALTDALHTALAYGNTVCTDLVLAAKPNQTALGQALYGAVSRGNTAAIKKLILQGADPNFNTGSYGTPLQLAQKKGNTEVLAILQFGTHGTH